VQVAPTTTATAYGEMGPYSFRLVPTDDRQGAFLARHVASQLPDGGRVAILHVSDDYGRGLRSAVVEGLRSSAIAVVVDLPHVDGDPDEIDFGHAVGAVQAASPDRILWLARAGTLNRFLGLLRAAGVEAPVIASDASASAVQFPNDDGRWNGVRYVDFVDINSTTALRDFRSRYRARFGGDVGGLEALHYDAMSLLLEGVRAGSRTGDELRAYLLSLGRERPSFKGITGLISFEPDGEVDRPYVMLEIAPGAGS
jgi:ABC-type branched-subunit amino acid transport system substrate-binding protein